MLATYLIGLREGIEAAIIISILVGYVVKLGERQHVTKIFGGAAAAVLLSLGIGFGLSGIASEVSETLEITITGITSLLAVVFVTWMIFWMARQSRAMAANLRSRVDAAVAKSAWSLATVAFLAVAREGVETSILLWSAARSAGGSFGVFGGAFLGLLTASVAGYLMYRGALKFNLGTFFNITGAYLVLIAAGIFSYAIGEFQELGLLPFLTNPAYDFSAALPEGSVPELILAGTIAFNTAPSLLQAAGWFAYVIPVAIIYGRTIRHKKAAPVAAPSAA